MMEVAVAWPITTKIPRMLHFFFLSLILPCLQWLWEWPFSAFTLYYRIYIHSGVSFLIGSTRCKTINFLRSICGFYRKNFMTYEHWTVTVLFFVHLDPNFWGVFCLDSGQNNPNFKNANFPKFSLNLPKIEQKWPVL